MLPHHLTPQVDEVEMIRADILRVLGDFMDDVNTVTIAFVSNGFVVVLLPTPFIPMAR